jgi:hypothetical protein
MRRLSKEEYKSILRGLKINGVTYAKKEKRKLRRMTFDDASITEDGFVIVGNKDGTMDWFANNKPSRCVRMSDVLEDRNIN